jgi:hypothetical protein
MTTDLALIRKTATEKDFLQRQIEEKRQRYKYFVSLFSSPEQQKQLLADIEKNAKTLIDELAKLPPDVPIIGERLRMNSQVAKKEIAAILLWLNAQFNVSQPLTQEQIMGLVDTITLEFSEFLIEDVATCFKRVVLGQVGGKVVYSLDTATVLAWLTDYRTAQEKAVALKSFNHHLSYK